MTCSSMRKLSLAKLVSAEQKLKEARKRIRRLEIFAVFVDSWCFDQELNNRMHGVDEDRAIDKLRRRLIKLGYGHFVRKKL